MQNYESGGMLFVFWQNITLLGFDTEFLKVLRRTYMQVELVMNCRSCMQMSMTMRHNAGTTGIFDNRNKSLTSFD
jgi:hypothetical protein